MGKGRVRARGHDHPRVGVAERLEPIDGEARHLALGHAGPDQVPDLLDHLVRVGCRALHAPELRLVLDEPQRPERRCGRQARRPPREAQEGCRPQAVAHQHRGTAR